MQFPESWLREFCNPPLNTEQLAETLTMAGLEVEELQPVAPPFTSVVIGEIKSAEQHPNADRLRVCQVDVGQASLLNIVCGAPNARVGIRIPCAMVGAELPPGEDGKPFQINRPSRPSCKCQIKFFPSFLHVLHVCCIDFKRFVTAITLHNFCDRGI